MKHRLFFFVLAIMLTSCSSLTSLHNRSFGKASQKQASSIARISSLDTEISTSNKQRLQHIGAWANGTDLALDRTSNQEPAILIAKETNQRVIALADKPDFNELQEIYKIVNSFMTNQTEAQKLLIKKDKTIEKLNLSITETQQSRETEVQQALSLAKINATNADTYKATLNQMDSFFGFGAIWYGVKKLVTKLAWFIGGGFVIYIILRFAAAMNPIANSIFSVVEMMFGWVIKTVETLAPKAVSFAGFTPTKTFADWRGTLRHVVDAMEMSKERESLGVDIKIDDILNEAAKSMDEADKERINIIKKESNWK